MNRLSHRDLPCDSPSPATALRDGHASGKKFPPESLDCVAHRASRRRSDIVHRALELGDCNDKIYYGMTPDRIHGSVQSAPFICGP